MAALHAGGVCEVCGEHRPDPKGTCPGARTEREHAAEAVDPVEERDLMRRREEWARREGIANAAAMGYDAHGRRLPTR